MSAEDRPYVFALAVQAAVFLLFVATVLFFALGHGAPSPAEDLRQSGMGCWTEPNPSQPEGVETLCGDLARMPAGSTRTTIYEDDPLWDCRTMGNRLCGPGSGHESDGRYAVCGLVTEQGVTEHLDAFAERCGR